tara:strand:- start:2234 stop:2974 length:741 start_codon:yes stop_codon:yes gene_type:complete
MLIRKLFKENKIYFFSYDHNSFFEGLYRLFGILISPLLIKLNPNFISILSLLCGSLGLIVSIFFSLQINFVVIFFISSFVLDFTDGIVARATDKTSFYGRFIDGLFDIFVMSFLHIVFLVHLINTKFTDIFSIYFILFIFVITLMPIQHLILDRFSSLARWCNEVNNDKKIKPYYRNIFFGKITKFLFDLQHLCIWLIFFNMSTSASFVVIIFFILSGTASILNIFIYIYLSRKNLFDVKNSTDND